MEISRKRFEIDAWYQLLPNRKWPMVDRMMTSLMTSVTLRGQGRDPNIFNARYFRKWLEIETRLQWSTHRKCHVRYRMVTWSM